MRSLRTSASVGHYKYSTKASRASLVLFVLLSCASVSASGQMLYYSDEFAGGVTAGGYSPNYAGSGTGKIQLHFPPGATIRKAFLFAGDHHSIAPITVQLNGTSFTFNDANRITPGFYSFYGSPAFVHATDVRSAIDPSVATQTLVVPDQPASSRRFTDFYLLVTYNIPSHTLSRVGMFIDTMGFDSTMLYVLPVWQHAKGGSDLCMGLYTGYICDIGDAEDIYCNSLKLGNIYGPQTGSGTCAGPFANFYYDNGRLQGLGDNNADLKMDHADVLSNIRTQVNPTDSTLVLHFIHSITHNTDNSIWGVVLVDGDTGCSEISTVSANPPSLNFNPMTLCAGTDSITEILTNPGCDPLIISSASLAGDPDYSAPGMQPLVIQPHDTARVTVYLTPHTKGPKKGSLWLTSYSISNPADSVKNMIKLNGLIGDGYGVLNSFPPKMSFQRMTLCSGTDSIPGFMVNTGCDTAFIENTSLSGADYTSSILPTAGVAPQDTLKFTIYLTPLSRGTKPGKFIMNWHSIDSPSLTIGDTLSLDGFVGDDWYDHSLFLDPPSRKGSAGETVGFILRTDADMAGVQTLDFDLAMQTEMLSFISGAYQNKITCTGGHIRINGSPFIRLRDSTIDTLRFEINLTKDSSDDLRLVHVRINGGDSTLSPCSSIASVSGATFAYQYLCGDHSIQKAMNGIKPLGITAIRPNPVTELMNLEFFSASTGDVSVTISNALGVCCIRRIFGAHTGGQILQLDISALASGAYTIELSGCGGREVSHFIKLQ